MPVHRDTIDLLVTAAYRSLPQRAPAHQLEHADRLGQLLADATDTPINYTWQPVAELLTTSWNDTLVAQLERSRLHLIENLTHDNPEAQAFCSTLGAAIRTRLGRRDTETGILTAHDLAHTQHIWHRPELTLVALAAEGLS